MLKSREIWKLARGLSTVEAKFSFSFLIVGLTPDELTIYCIFIDDK